MKLIVYEAATPNEEPPENQGTKREVEILDSGTPQERCQALIQQFPGHRISFYDTSDGLPGWTDVAEDTIDALSDAVQVRRQLRVFKQGKRNTAALNNRSD